jgi:LPXTG-motif cell wall-anchored protein
LVTFAITVKNRGQQASVNGHVWDIVPSHLEVLEVETIGEHEGLLIHPIDEQTVRVDTGILGQDAELTILVHTKVRPFEVGPVEDGEASPPAICIDNVAHFHADNCPEVRAQAEPCLLPDTGDETNRWWVLAAVLATSVLVLGLVFSKRWRLAKPDRVG